MVVPLPTRHLILGSLYIHIDLFVYLILAVMLHHLVTSLSPFLLLQVIVGIGAKPAVGPFEKAGLDSNVGGIQVPF